MVERFDSIQAVVVFGSYARGEEKEDSDLDTYLIFDHLKPSILLEVGEACRGFFPLYNKEVSYPLCLTKSDFYSKYMNNGSTDPIKYFESIVTYGKLPMKAPNKEKVSEFYNKILVEAMFDLRYGFLKNNISPKCLIQVVKLLVIALKLERYLTTNHYPKTVLELRHCLKDKDVEIIPIWFQNKDLFQENMVRSKENVINRIFSIVYKLLECHR
jgi:hypothetical protein